MKILVAAAAYPTPEGKRPLYYVHSRNLYYRQAGIELTVLNFAANQEYWFDGFRVIPQSVFEKEAVDYDMLICHAANIRNHYRFLIRHGDKFAKKLFFFHGHEVLRVNKYYPRPYSFVKTNEHNPIIHGLYDEVKLFLWRWYYSKHIDDLRMIFVSKWIFNKFLLETGLKKEALKGHDQIISNSVGAFFENNRYDPQEMHYDFLTIRGDLDGSKYCVDIVVELARKHPHYRFCVIGKGSFFEYVQKPDNMTVINGEMAHADMERYMNCSRYALLPTREDTQGLMACEMAAYGMPLITSDIEVCREVFSTCPNVALISNESPDLDAALKSLKPYHSVSRWEAYFAKNTIYKEIEYIKHYLEEV